MRYLGWFVKWWWWWGGGTLLPVHLILQSKNYACKILQSYFLQYFLKVLEHSVVDQTIIYIPQQDSIEKQKKTIKSVLGMLLQFFMLFYLS